MALRDARPDNGRPSLRQTARACRAGQRPLGDGSIWYGSPQDQIQAFRSFEIAPKLLDTYRYPELTPQLKAKIFGLNGARVYGVDIPAERKKTEADPIGLRKACLSPARCPCF